MYSFVLILYVFTSYESIMDYVKSADKPVAY